MIKILAIDDDKHNRVVLEIFLKVAFPNIQITGTQAGPKGVQTAREQNPDVIIVGGSTAKADGLKVCELLKKEGITKDIPIIFTSAYPENGRLKEQAIRAGAEGILPHPFNEVELISQVNALVNLKKAVSAARNQQELMEFAAGISAGLTDVSPQLITEKIEETLEKTGRLAAADRAFLYLFREKISLRENAFEWCDSSIEPVAAISSDIPLAHHSWWMNKFRNNDYVFLGQPEKNPKENFAENNFLTSQKMKSVLAVPVYTGKGLVGFMGLNSLGENRWKEFHIQFMKIISSALCSSVIAASRQNKLIQAKEKAEESDRLKSAFLVNMSHDIRTPMNGILGFVDLLRNPELSGEEQKQYADYVKTSSERLLNTVSDIIEISKIESGQAPLIYSIENANEIMHYLHRSLLPEAEEKGLTLILDETCGRASTDQTFIKTDKMKLLAVLKKLVQNAIQFNEKGAVELAFEVKNENIVFCISDSGPEIDGERFNAAFNRFAPVHPGVNGQFENSVLSPAITRAYAELLHGQMWVESEAGKGNNIYFSLNHDSVIPKKYHHER